eukprot:gene27955-8837_t
MTSKRGRQPYRALSPEPSERLRYQSRDTALDTQHRARKTSRHNKGEAHLIYTAVVLPVVNQARDDEQAWEAAVQSIKSRALRAALLSIKIEDKAFDTQHRARKHSRHNNGTVYLIYTAVVLPVVNQAQDNKQTVGGSSNEDNVQGP